MKLSKLKQGILGFLMGAIIFSGVGAYAASGTSITAYFLPLKYYFDGVEKVTPADQQGFIYQGTTYVPLRFMAESLGEEVGWDGKTKSIYVGEQPSGEITYINDMKTHVINSYGYGVHEVSTFTTNTGETFSKGYYIDSMYSNAYLRPQYILNGQYEKFEAFIAPSSKWNTLNQVDNLGNVKIYGDGKLLFDSGAVASDITKPIKVEIDLTGVLKLEIQLNQSIGYPQLGLLDSKFIR